MHAALPYMRERGGTVVMLCTDAARHATAGESIPGAVGASIILMTKVFAKEFARWRIRVTGQSAQVTGQTISVNGGLSFGGW